ncbi:hypothetical protein AC579_6677 [Pseudocercospora musae]|uniref:Uncharacterized protein n=1 Tax=Pseudocercospora musae TaxID=113226 RepID=A0A139IPA5_9PEZI|nr:hypothetical protein AC579_6677 [Pseudocercospora musae]
MISLSTLTTLPHHQAQYKPKMWKSEAGLAKMEAEKRAAAEKKIITSLKHSLQECYDSNPPKNLVKKDHIPDNEDQTKAVIKFLTTEIEKFQSELDSKISYLNRELEKLQNIERENGRAVSTMSTTPEVDKELYLKKEDDLEVMSKEELKGYAWELVCKCVELGQASKKATGQTLSVLGAMNEFDVERANAEYFGSDE